MKIFYAVSTHWDREWYKPFQGFRYDLVKMTDKLIEALEKGEIDVFTFDGQTIVLEDYLEIKPYNKERIIELIKDGKLKVGPWYIMPDELLVSGESLIKNFIVGKKISKEFGGKPWKYGYMNDIFGHIAQMPQLLNDMNINCGYLGRGVGRSDQNFSNFIWCSPDGSKCYAYKENYTAVKNRFSKENTKECVESYLKDKVDGTGMVIMLYTGDHSDIDDNIFDFIKVKNNLSEEYEIVEGLEHIGNELEKLNPDLPCETGELITTGETAKEFRAVTHSISSYYPIKRENDICQDILENKLSPMLSMAKLKNMEFESGFLNTAYKYLLKNQPHDSICGCSCDVVHEDMLYRYSQIHSIDEAVTADYENRITSQYDREKEFCIEVQNFSPKSFEGTFVTNIYFAKNWGNKITDNAFYQQINGFSILDEKGEIVPYQIIDIKKDYRTSRKPYALATDKYTVAVSGKLKPFGGTVFKIVSGKSPVFVKTLSDGELIAENEYMIAEVENNGSITLTDKQSGKVYKNLNTFIDDGEIGNGWFSERPIGCNNIVSSKGTEALIEVINNGPILTAFRITKMLRIPEYTDYGSYKRSENRTELKIVTDVTLKAKSKCLEFETTVYNNACGHRLRVEFPTEISGGSYFASQAFTFIERGRGISEAAAAYREPEAYEKNTDGIVVIGDSEKGLSFIGKEGFHECAVSHSGVITATMLRSFGRIMFNNIENKKAELIGEHKFRYALSTETDFSNLTEIKKTVMNTYSNTFTDLNRKSDSLLSVEGKVCVSIIKPSEDGKGIIIRLYNPTNREENAELKTHFNIKNAKLVNVLEEDISPKNFENNNIKLQIKPQKIVTIYLEN